MGSTGNDDRFDGFPDPARFTVDDNRVRRLGLSILAKAADDAENGTPVLRLGALAWLTNASEDLRTICEIARVHPETVLKTWRKKIKRVVAVPKWYYNIVLGEIEGREKYVGKK